MLRKLFYIHLFFPLVFFSCDAQMELGQLTKSLTPVKKTAKKGIDIQKAMDYPITDVVERYKKEYGISDEVAKLHERELKRYLILCAENSPKQTPMFSTTVDNLWHVFLLFTKDYEKYCKEALGEFIHHVPQLHDDLVV